MNVLRRVRQGAAISAALGTAGALGVLVAEVVAARTRRYARPDLRLAIRTSIGETTAPPLRLVLLGDASALGVGVDRARDTVGAQLAELLATGPAGTVRRVELSSVAVSGSCCADLGTQVSRALLGGRPDIAVILVGANDVTAMHRPAEAARHLATAVRRLADADVAVIVGTCPDLGAVRAFAPPLRQVMGVLGRRMAHRQADAVHGAGGTPVDLASRAGPVFRADAGTFCHDGYHPSADGYRVWAHALFPAVAEAAGVTRTS